MRVLLTRPRENSERLGSVLRAKGHEPVLSPVLEIRCSDGLEVRFDDVRAILATSANGIRALARRTPRRDLPVFAVGSQTAAVAQDAGFVAVRDAGAGSEALARAVQGWVSPEGGALLYAAGRDRSGELESILRHRGYSLRIEVLYEAVEQVDLSAEAHVALASGGLNAVMLFSPRSAAIFARQVQLAGLAQPCGGLIAICISDAVAKAAAPLTFAEIRIAAKPNQEGMLALLD